jgi:hypothetical protein
LTTVLPYLTFPASNEENPPIQTEKFVKIICDGKGGRVEEVSTFYFCCCFFVVGREGYKPVSIEK